MTGICHPAKRLGITPLKSSEDLGKADRNLKEIKSCKLFQVDKLTHSEPYLVPEACDLLADIARNFKDSLYQKGLPSHSIIVTSVLRTGSSVKKLRKSNGNASANSAHVYGTTFDVAYTRFKKDGVKLPGGKVEKCVSRRVAGFAFAKEMLRSLRV